MPSGALQRIFSRFDPSEAKSVFFWVQLGVALVAVVAVFLVSRNREQSRFRVREADLKRPKPRPGSPDSLGEAKMKRAEPLRLSGIRIDGEPHEILGIPANSDSATVQRAYRELMKRYHPDIIGRPGSREWADAQKIAEAINNARNRMLAAQSQNPNRSGR